ncbi:hypothetical protein JCM24511_05959 [Saitozyma sp. JCM 24511]|nr:hypothetical protein JCM24511_05959 [Saitozyma sp. JCM 24511]
MALGFAAKEASAGYMTVSINQFARLTWIQTSFASHGYNLWIPEIDNASNNITIPINQPAGLSYLVTVWGASGIEYAGTTDVQTVGDSLNTTCFLNDTQILNLYTFSFNISDTSGGYPPQCSNLSMTWPTSLESNVTGTVTKRSSSSSPVPDVGSAVDSIFKSDAVSALDIQINQLDTSSSDHTSGNTTAPPTLFGIIPLGNSFSIPITYGNNSKIASKLPASSLSDTPTTWASQGVSHLNWTIDLAKGTRFILVAGIGSEQQWASGGSSTMLTVGQGSTGCVGSEQTGGDPAPSITGSSTSTATVVPDDGSGTQPVPGGISGSAKTAIACALSVVVTLVVVGVGFFFCRVRRRRRAAALAAPFPINSGKGASGNEMSPSDTPLDLIASRDGSRSLAPINTSLPSGAGAAGQRSATSPTSSSDPFGDETPSRTLLSSRTGTLDDTMQSSPISPIRGRHRDEILRSTAMGRHESQEALLRHGSTISSPLDAYNGGGTGTFPSLPSISTHRPLMLHDRTLGLPDEENEEPEDLADLKRETLAYLGQGQHSGSSRGAGAGAGAEGEAIPMQNRQGGGGGGAGGQGRRRRTDDREMEYVVHRDAGRVDATQQGGQAPRVLELPPRYEELDWDAEREAEGTLQRTVDTVGTDTDNATGTATGTGLGTGTATGTVPPPPPPPPHPDAQPPPPGL